MKRHLSHRLSQFCLLAAATLAAPAAFSESAIVKCVDSAGRVTLTDRPCEAGAATVRMASMAANEGVTRIEPYPLVAERSVLPPARASGQRAAPMQRVAAKPLMRDVATLKAARAQFLLSDVGAQPALANLE
jgi:hypothetical protein